MLSSDAQVGVVSNNGEGVLDEEVNGTKATILLGMLLLAEMERWQRAELLMARRNMVMLAQQQQNQQWPDTTYELYEYE
ncbi:hypothetical protein Tco_0781583 [Tanacetum coccineum]